MTGRGRDSLACLEGMKACKVKVTSGESFAMGKRWRTKVSTSIVNGKHVLARWCLQSAAGAYLVEPALLLIQEVGLAEQPIRTPTLT